MADGAWWQLLTSAFTHVEIWHVAMNMFALLLFGPALEWIIGRTRFLAVYLVSALGGSAAVMLLSSPSGSTVGASGALFGLLGALLVVARKARLDTRALLQNLGLGVAISVYGLVVGGISWQGHLGGFVAGAAAAAVVAYAPRARRTVVQWTGLGLLAVVAGGHRRGARSRARLRPARRLRDIRPPPRVVRRGAGAELRPLCPQVCTQVWITTGV